MFDSVFAAVERILGSKKVLIVFVGFAVDALAVFGLDVSPDAVVSGLGLVFNVGIAGLAVGQLILDAIHGSASDGTVKKLAEQAGLEDDLEDLRGFVSEIVDKVDALQEAAGEAEFDEDVEDDEEFVEFDEDDEDFDEEEEE